MQWARGHSHGNLQQTELSLTAVIYSELGGGPSPEAVLSMELPELKTHKLEAALAVERAAVEVLAEIAERCQADSRGCEFCYVRGGCDPDNMAKCARAEARKRLGLGEEVQSGPD